MVTFRSFWQAQQLIREFDEHPVVRNPFQSQGKSWSAKKQEIIQTWQNLRPDVPILITPIEDMAAGQQSYGEDGIRLTGSWQFITSVLGRLKDLISYENPHTRLRLVLRAVEPKNDNGVPMPLDRPAYVFYLNVENRGQGKAGRPKKVTPTL